MFGCICLEKTIPNLRKLRDGKCPLEEHNSQVILQMLNEMLSEQKLTGEIVQLAFNILGRISAEVIPLRKLDLSDMHARITQYLHLYTAIVRGIKQGVVGNKSEEMLLKLIPRIGSETLKWIDVLSDAYVDCMMIRIETDYMLFLMAKLDSRCINSAKTFLLPQSHVTASDGKKLPIQLKIAGRDRRGDEAASASFVGFWLKQTSPQVPVRFTESSSILMKFLPLSLNSELFYFQASPTANILFRQYDSFEIEFLSNNPNFKKLASYCASFNFTNQR